MSEENPCLACPDQQSCCTQLKYLRLNRVEYERAFARHEAKLDVDREGPFYVVSVKGQGCCPHWDGHCTIYDTRPMECALFPHAIGSVFAGEVLTLSVHDYTDCPLKSQLLPPDAEAIARVAQFAEELAEDGQSVRVFLEKGGGRIEVLARRALKRVLGVGRFDDSAT